jgi:Cu+-exporting ATPase
MNQATTYKQNSIDPVCGMSVDSTTGIIASDHAGQTYYFCAESCRRAFEAKPRKYRKPKKRASGDGIWVGCRNQPAATP